MRPVKEIALESPLKTAAAIIGSVSVILGAVFTIDQRYAHAADISQYKSAVAKDLQTQSRMIEQQNVVMRRQYIEDKMFELDVKRDNGKLSPIEEAVYRRYSRQLEEMKDGMKLK